MPALNSAQRELVQMILGYNQQFTGVYDLLNELQVVETHSIDTSGFNLGSVTTRHLLRNGLLNVSIVDDDDYTRFATRVTTDKFGITENRYFEGTTRDPKYRVFGNRLYLLISVGGYPRNATIYYIGQPYDLVTTVTVASGKSQNVTTCDLNIVLHDLVVLLAEVKLRRMRGDDRDFKEAQLVSQFVSQQLSLLISGATGEPQQNTLGQFTRDQEKFMNRRANQ